MANYLDENELREELWRCQQAGQVSAKLVNMFNKISIHTSRIYKYVNADDRQDCISNATLIQIEKYQKCDLSAGKNAFSYYTQVAINGLRAGWNHLAGHRKVTHSIDSVFEDSI